MSDGAHDPGAHEVAATEVPTPEQVELLVAAAREIVDGAVGCLAGDVRGPGGRVDESRLVCQQPLAYDISVAASWVTAAEQMLAWGRAGELEALLTAAFAGHVAVEIGGLVQGRETAWGIESVPWAATGDATVHATLTATRSAALLERIADAVVAQPLLPRPLDDDLAEAGRAFRDFARAKVAPLAERIHREDADIPDDLLEEFARMGFFSLGITEEYGGLASGGSSGHSEVDLKAMLVASEEVAKASMALAGPFITRPEILATAVLKGGTEEQARRWLPKVASGEAMVGVAVTEPDFGSDVARLTTTAIRQGDYYRVRGTKTWSTFSGRAELVLLLARTGTREELHRGLSLFVVEKPAFAGHEWVHEDGMGGRMVARSIPTIGYRGMHSFEISFDDFHVPGANLIGENSGLGRGFYLQMNAFANGRMQTAARAVGLMQASLETAVRYAQERSVFGRSLADYSLTRAKLAKMAYLTAACRFFAYRCAELIANGGGQLEASMVKSFACRSAEWVTREAQQLHGGYGYAEEYAVSRYFLDARVLSLFEGADEVLALRVIIKRLLDDALAPQGT